MRAWLLPRIGSLDLMTLGEAPDPVAGAGEAVLRLLSAGLNPADRYLAEGMYPAKPSFPHILGRDGVGVVEAVGAGVVDWKIGDVAVIVRSEVGVSRPGTFAEKIAVPVASLVRGPAGWSTEQAAGATLVYLTAWQALTQWNEPGAEPGQKPSQGVVLVTGASGGVGIAAIHLAKAFGYKVVGLSRGPTKIAAIKAQGADHVLDPHDPNWCQTLKATLGSRRVDLAIDNIGGQLFGELIDVMAMGGRISVVGQLAGPVPNFATATLFFRRLRIGGVSVGSYTADESAAEWKAIVDRLRAAGRQPLVDKVFDFHQLPDAFAHLTAGPLGKVLLAPLRD